MNITQHKEDLMMSVTNERSGCPGRPLFFVAHSLGGILVKGAITESLDMEEQLDLQDLGRSCRAIFFFGTPHFGANSAAYATIVSNIIGSLPGTFSTNDEILRGLSPDSEVLYAINRDFNKLLNQNIEHARKIQIYCFQEDQGMTSVQGFSGKVVPDESSKLNRTDVERSSFVQDADHITMCNFASASKASYQHFVRTLNHYLQMNEKLLEERNRDSEGTQNARPNGYVAAHTSTTSVPSDLQMSSLTQNAELLRDLNFAERTMKERQLNKLSCKESSFSWVWTSELGDWLKTRDTFFWVAGKPASGKSTLVNYVRGASEIQSVLPATPSSDWQIIYHFFDFRVGAGVANNFEGVLRDLLYQLFSNIEDVARDVKKTFCLRENESIVDANLRRILDHVLSTTREPVLLFLDGLDEYEGNMIKLVEWVQELAHPNVKICLSSRPDPDLLAVLGLFPTLRMDVANAPGIEPFALETLERQPSQLRHGTDLIKRVAAHISFRAQGVFLWARFAVYEVIAGTNRREDSDMIQHRLERLPAELEEIYSRIFSRMDPDGRMTAGVFLHLVITSLRPLNLSELFEATILADVTPWKSGVPINDRALRNFEDRIIVSGGGILETVNFHLIPGLGDTSEVRIIHRTVQTYLEKGGWVELFQADEAQRRLQTWPKICAAFLRAPSERVKWTHSKAAPYMSSRQRRANNTAQCSLGPYIFTNLLEILNSLNDNDCPSWTEVYSLFTEEFVREHVRLSPKHTPAHECDCGNVSALSGDVTTWPQLAVIHALSQRMVPYLSFLTSTSSATSSSFSSNPPWHVPELYRLGALCASVKREGRRSTGMLQLLSPFVTEPVDDTTMLRLLRWANMEDIQTCLERFPRGKLILKSSVFCCCRAAPWKKCGCQNGRRLRQYSPLWVLTHRIATGVLGGETRKLFDLFISRGEDVNGRNGPEGHLLHIPVMLPLSRLATLSASLNAIEMLDLLISYRPKFETTDSEENPLERCWKCIHTRSMEYECVTRLRGPHIRILVRKLLNSGMKNRKKDPNGLIPTPERMANIGTYYVRYNTRGTELTALSDAYPQLKHLLDFPPGPPAGVSDDESVVKKADVRCDPSDSLNPNHSEDLDSGLDSDEDKVLKDDLHRTQPDQMNEKPRSGINENNVDILSQAWSTQSWCMWRAFFHTGETAKWEDFFDQSELYRTHVTV